MKSRRILSFTIFFLFAVRLGADVPALFLGLRPMIGTIEIGSGLAGGLRYKKSIFQAAVAYSTAGYQQAEFQIGLNPPRRGLFLRPIRYEYEDVYDLPPVQPQGVDYPTPGPVIYFEYRYRDRRQLDYFGLTATSRKSNHTDFDQRDNSF